MDTFRCATCTTDAVTNIKTCVISQVTKKLFFPRCANTNLLCSAKRGAYVAAITVCNQSL